MSYAWSRKHGQFLRHCPSFTHKKGVHVRHIRKPLEYYLSTVMDTALRHSSAYHAPTDVSPPPIFPVSLPGSSQKALLIVLNRDVSGDQFVGALSEELKPRLQALGGGQEAQEEFEKLIKAQDLKKGTAVFLTWALPASLQVMQRKRGCGCRGRAQVRRTWFLQCTVGAWEAHVPWSNESIL